VPSFAPAGNDVRAVVPCHADVKLVQSGAWIAPKSFMLVLFWKAFAAKIRAGKLIAGNDTRAV